MIIVQKKYNTYQIKAINETKSKKNLNDQLDFSEKKNQQVETY